MTRFGRLALAIVLPAAAAAAAPAAADTAPDLAITRGASVVRLNAQGVLTEVPFEGLAVADGHRVTLRGGFSEWFSVRYRTPSGDEEFAGLGRSRDWANRRSVAARRSWTHRGEAFAVADAGDLEVTTQASFDAEGRYVHVLVTLVNRGPHLLKDVLYAREWRGSGIEAQQSGPRPPRLREVSRGIARRVWTFEDMPPGTANGLRFSYEVLGAPQAAMTADPLPLALWTHPDHPEGLALGPTNGISWGDFDADGFIDLFAFQSAHLWRNVGGVTWELAADLDDVVPHAEWRYGASFGDYDNDGLPDIATEPRIYVGDQKVHLLKNLGGGQFADVAGDQGIVDVQPFGDSETNCWADVDADGDLDLFVPTYPEWVEQGPGNFFLENLGPTGPGGAYRFAENTLEAGLINPQGTSRPEGAQFADVDADGDPDLFSNGTLYRNVSARGVPRFEPMTEATSGIGLRGSLDEGAAFIDYDLDGDDDLFVVYTQHGVRIWENQGDGTFFGADQDILDEPLIGLNLGLSAEDWDNDGDVDITTRQVFRRNMLMEEGERRFAVAAHQIPAEHLTPATPAWGDWDQDGDLDCALGNWGGEGHFYENRLYGPATPGAQRRYVRIVPVRDAAAVPDGLRTEYGAVASVRAHTDPDALRRRRFASSSHGYLNQNAYALHFALPADPVPQDPSVDLRFDVTVDFPGLPHEGLWRIDRHVNPALGSIDLADLEDREIVVSRCGAATIDGVVHEPAPLAPLTLAAAPEQAAPALTRGAGAAAAAVAPAPAGWVGLVFDTMAAGGPLRIAQIALDGQLEAPQACGAEEFNIGLWDVTDAQTPVMVSGSALARTTSPRNLRTWFGVDLILEPQRRYRLVARATQTRGSSTTGGAAGAGGLTVGGSIVYDDAAPCSGAVVVLPRPDPRSSALSIRYAPVPADGGLDPIGDGLALRLEQDLPVLTWPDIGAGGYHVLRCSAATGPCGPAPVAATTLPGWTDDRPSPDPGEILWYQVRAVNACTYAVGMPAAAASARDGRCVPQPCATAAPGGEDSGALRRASRPPR